MSDKMLEMTLLGLVYGGSCIYLRFLFLSSVLYVCFASAIGKWLAGKVCPRNDLLHDEWEVKLYTLSQLGLTKYIHTF